MTDKIDDKLLVAAKRLKTEIAPERDLWPEIAAAMSETAEPRRSRWTPMLAQAAAVILLVGASSSITYMVVKDQEQPITRVAPELLFEQTAFGNRYNLGPGFQDARNELVAELDVELERLSPESRAEIETNIGLIHTAILDINEALEQEPDNVLLQQQLLNAYREELTLLRRVGGLTRNIMARNDI